MTENEMQQARASLNQRVVTLMGLISYMVDLAGDGERKELIKTSDVFLDACSDLNQTLYDIAGVTHDDVYGEKRSSAEDDDESLSDSSASP
jgi:hypothetical protein